MGNPQNGDGFFPGVYGIDGAIGGYAEAVILMAFEFFTLGREGVRGKLL